MEYNNFDYMRSSHIHCIFASFFLLLVACGPSSGDAGLSGSGASQTGQFQTLGTNVLDGYTWQLNRPIRLEFNHTVDPSSVNFSSIVLRATDSQHSGVPVTGTFEIEEGSGGTAVIFRPACPTDEFNTDGAFVPGNVTYQLYLPTQENSATVLRDTEGRPLTLGLTRDFVTPGLTEPYFLDLVPGAPQVLNPSTDVTFPSSVNFWANQDDTISVRFNQAINASPANLNANNLVVLYSDTEIGGVGENSFSATNVVPGSWVMIENCNELGALVEFHITGVLPVNRNLQVLMTSNFTDIAGQKNTTDIVVGTHSVPTLSALYDDPSWLETDETIDEFTESFQDTQYLDLDQALPVPLAQVEEGFIAASFDYPGIYVSNDQDFFIEAFSTREIFTDSQSSFMDSNNRLHTVQSGVLNVHNLTIERGATLRGRGLNPLIIYATGEVRIEGKINVCGNNAVWPSGLNSPSFIEGGALGECGGGQGGDASQIGDSHTPRGENGDGPFGLALAGGQGGEGSFNQHNASTGTFGLDYTVSGGGGGGGFALGENASVLWPNWKTGNNWAPSYFNTGGPDHKISRHTAAVGANGIFGAEDGMRGINRGGSRARGMEDGLEESQAVDTANDPAWTTGPTPPFDFGHPTNGADPGAAGPSIFKNDGDLLNDFWGSRLSDTGEIVAGELLTAWAGAGGGGGGDSMLIRVWDRDGDGQPDPLETFFPVVPFVKSTSTVQDGWTYYRKGAGGGGGGGQLMIMSIGMIILGDDAEIQANGGVGYTGESLIYTDAGVSGSGGGSGGHIVLHSSTGLDVSDLDIGTASNQGQIGNLVDNGAVQALGGRRGQAGGAYYPSSTIGRGAQTYTAGRGGAGGNGVIQIHVPDPTTDIVWHPSSKNGIEDYVNSSPGGIPTDRVEEVLSHLTFPNAFVLIPFYSSTSMIASEWIDTGLAELRLGDPNTYPDWAVDTLANPDLLAFTGINPADGKVVKQGPFVRPTTDIVAGSTDNVVFDLNTLTISNASSLFPSQYLRLPDLLLGYDILPDNAASSTFEIQDVAYDSLTDVMVLGTSASDGLMTFALNSQNPVWSIKPKFFRIDTSGVKNRLPSSTNVFFEFQGADEIAPGTNIPGNPSPSETSWTTDLSTLQGSRFLRYRIKFDADSQGNGIDLTSPLPVMSYVKIPYVF